MSTRVPLRKGGAAPAPTFTLAQFAASLHGDALPPDIKTTLGELFLDYVRVASIGAEMPWSAWADGYMASLGGEGRAAVLFRPQRRDAVRAAFLNATYAGSIDADDTHVGSMLHPGSIVFSAALALADETDAGGKDFIAAVAAGYEAMIRIGLSIQPSHFQRGFQSTATCGGFGSAVAAARLAFNGEKTADHKIAASIGLVASFAGGLTQFYQSGSTVKRIHAARAAENGVAAALLARHGFTGPQDILEGANGFARAYADSAALGIVTEGLGRDYLLREVTVKGHACSARVQAAVEGILDLCRPVDPDDVLDVFVGIPAVILGRLTIPKPVDVQAAQMSLPHSAALAVAMAGAAEAGFALSVTDYETSLDDPQVKRIEALVRCEIDPEVEAATTAQSVPARVTISLKDGTRHSAFVSAPKGSPSRPFTHDDHVARFRRELSKRLTDKTCDEIVDIAENLADLDKVKRITDLLAVARVRQPQA
ncbi:MAG TPA: MmgE/PrpD family protein [Xanthobacteraceae bacterium]